MSAARRTLLLSFRDAERETGVSYWTWRDLAARGAISTIRPPGVRRVYIERTELDAALDRWREREPAV